MITGPGGLFPSPAAQQMQSSSPFRKVRLSRRPARRGGREALVSATLAGLLCWVLRVALDRWTGHKQVFQGSDQEGEAAQNTGQRRSRQRRRRCFAGRREVRVDRAENPKEQKTYSWAVLKGGEVTGEPISAHLEEFTRRRESTRQCLRVTSGGCGQLADKPACHESPLPGYSVLCSTAPQPMRAPLLQRQRPKPTRKFIFLNRETGTQRSCS